MTPIERVHKAPRMGKRHRFPIVEFLVDERVARAIIPDAVDGSDFMDRIGLDAVSRSSELGTVRENPDGFRGSCCPVQTASTAR